jgi:predicted acetyltransferase
MTAIVRAALPDDAQAVLEIMCQAFGLDVNAARPIFYADPYFDLSCKRVLSLPGAGIVSCLTVVPTTLRIGGVPMPAAGIAGVATRPAFQRRGYAATLLAATVPALCTELGFPTALLHPVSAPFYQKLGWEYASRSVRWLTVPASFPACPEAACVRPASEGDWPAIEALHDRQTRGGTGSFQRDARRWRLIRMPVPGREAFVYERGGEISGYGIWERHDVLHLLELAASTDDARRGLRGFLARQPDALLEWSASPALLDRFGLSGAGLTPEPGVMLRLVDLEAALSLLHPAHYAPALATLGTTLTIQADDPLYARNTQPLRLTAEGISRSSRTDGPWLHADIRVLARLYAGDLLPSDAAAQNLLASDSPQTLGIADRLFPLREPYVAPLDQF